MLSGRVRAHTHTHPYTHTYIHIHTHTHTPPPVSTGTRHTLTHALSCGLHTCGCTHTHSTHSDTFGRPSPVGAHTAHLDTFGHPSPVGAHKHTLRTLRHLRLSIPSGWTQAHTPHTQTPSAVHLQWVHTLHTHTPSAVHPQWVHTHAHAPHTHLRPSISCGCTHAHTPDTHSQPSISHPQSTRGLCPGLSVGC